MKTLWNQIKFQKDLYLLGGLVMLGLYIFGTILHDVIIVSDDGVTSTFCMGSLMAMSGFIMVMFFFAGIHMVQVFNYALAMGQTRKRTYPAYALAVFITFFVLAVGSVWERNFQNNIQKIMDEAERLMYQEKSEYYRMTGIDRRK